MVGASPPPVKPRLFHERASRRGEQQMRDPCGAERSGLKPATGGQVPGTSFEDGGTDRDHGRCWQMREIGVRVARARLPDCPQVLFLFMGVRLGPNAWSVSSAPVRTESDPVGADKGGGCRPGGPEHGPSPTGTVGKLAILICM